MISIKKLNKKTLQEFVSSGQYKNYDFLPITEHRAFSHIKNPKAGENDTLLCLAFENEKLAGYLGALPDSFTVDEESFKYAWLSTLFVHENFRGKNIAKMLLDEMFDAYNGNIAITEFTQEAERLYNKTRLFEYINPKHGKRYYFRTDFQTFLPAKKENLNALKPLFQFTDCIANSLISFKNYFASKPDFKFEIGKNIDNESLSFISDFKCNRTADDLKWMIENPWVLEGKENNNYLFSGFSKEFKYFWIKISDKDNHLKTCSLILLRDGHLKIPYFFSNENGGDFVKFLSWFISENKVKMLTCYHPEINKILITKSLANFI